MHELEDEMHDIEEEMHDFEEEMHEIWKRMHDFEEEMHEIGKECMTSWEKCTNWESNARVCHAIYTIEEICMACSPDRHSYKCKLADI